MDTRQVVVYANKRRQKSLHQSVEKVVASYDQFFLAQATPAQMAALQDKGIEFEEAESQFQAKEALSPTSAPTEGRHHYRVTFAGPVKKIWLQRFEEMGAVVRDAMPPHSYIMELDATQVDTIAGWPFVQAVEHYEPKLRIAPDVLRQVLDKDQIENPSLGAMPAGEPPSWPKEASAFGSPSSEEKETREPTSSTSSLPIPPHAEANLPPPERRRMHEAASLPSGVMVLFYTPEQLQAALPAIKQTGCRYPTPPPNSTALPVQFPKKPEDARAALDTISKLHGIKEISSIVLRQAFNDVASFLIGAPTVMATLGLTGEGEIIGVADTGLDSGQLDNLHPDFNRRVLRLSSWPISSLYAFYVDNPNGDDGPADAYNGHGTHVAASAVGDGSAARAKGIASVPAGIAPAAKLVFQAVQQKAEWTDQYKSSYHQQKNRDPEPVGLLGLPPDISVLLQEAYQNGVRIHNNSWGGGTFGVYDNYSEGIDRFVWEHPDFLVLCAAGNYGRDYNGDGHIDENSLMPPATAKNVVTVGASESNRPDIGVRSSWGRAWPGLYRNTVYNADPVASDPNQVAAFSGRGPTADGRIKPDLVAPGTNIVSARSRALPAGVTAWGSYPPDSQDYMVDGGTSMATPLVSGAAALLRQYLRRRFRLPNPPAALLKALLIHSSEYRPDPMNPGTGPADFVQGWGHLKVEKVLRPQLPRRVHWRTSATGLQTGEAKRYYFTLYLGTTPLQITLVWNDYPARANQPHALVNDLDLIVVSPLGQHYHGNIFQPPHNKGYDRQNNVEQVFIERPLPGRYVIMVRAFNVMMGPQPFALVYSGVTGSPTEA